MHITEDALVYLGEDYEVENGNGAERHVYIRDHNVKTYLIVAQVRRELVSLPPTGSLSLSITGSCHFNPAGDAQSPAIH